uniref:BRCT domain-containing protein n=1 Tax=Auxenochlorella protothecoides TaxID=3075 RepID=A0A1D1ZQP1_AUXPR
MSFSPDGGGRRGDMALKHVFEGCRLVFWHKSHVSRMKDRVVDRGGSIAAALDKDTTHVVSGANTSLVTAAAHLAQAEHVRPSLSLDIDSMRVAAPTGVHFVLPTWITASMLKQTRQAESDHLSPFGQRLAAAMPQAHGEAAVSGPGEHSGSGSADGKGPGAKQRERAGSPPSSKTGSGLGTSPAHAPTWTGGSGAPLCDAEPLPRKKARRPQPPAPCRVERVGSEFVAIEGDTLPRFTGGDSGLPWGWAGVWEEPWDEATAMWVTRFGLGLAARLIHLLLPAPTASPQPTTSPSLQDEQGDPREAAAPLVPHRQGSDGAPHRQGPGGKGPPRQHRVQARCLRPAPLLHRGEAGGVPLRLRGGQGPVPHQGSGAGDPAGGRPWLAAGGGCGRGPRRPGPQERPEGQGRPAQRGVHPRRCRRRGQAATDPGALQRRVGRRPHHGPEMVCGWRPQPRGRGPAARPDGAAADRAQVL